MFAVVFRTTLKELDAEYDALGERMRRLALEEYGCTQISVCTEGDQEIAVSYWPSLSHIEAWRADEQHRQAQALGKARWYQRYQVEVMEIKRAYRFEG
ncbi:MAG: antibiotic biosynthesis monooxygenase [Pseudomonadota bacterium]